MATPTPVSRRGFLLNAAAVPAVLGTASSLRAAGYDLIVRGGRVIDPAQHLDKVADVGVRGGKIAAIQTEIRDAAADVVDARGKIVVPGLIDIHVHARDAELPPSEFLSTGVTTMVDGGSRGADNIGDMIAIAKAAPNRLRMLLNIARLGNNNPGNRGEFLDGIEPADVAKARAAVEQHREWIVGLKARVSRSIAGDLDKEVLRRARQVADPMRIPIMVHIGDTASPLPDLLALLRRGDIVTHVYAPPPHGIMDDRGRVLPQVREARKRGVLFDFGNGLNKHWTWEIAESALKQDFPPDTLSTDLNLPGRTDQVFDLPNVMSKFLLMGMSLPEVIAMVSSHSARVFREFSAYGSLRTGTPADITVLDPRTGDFTFTDNEKGRRMGSQRLFPFAVVMGGKRFGSL